MLFKKKKPKLDPKVRFQNRQWNQKLQQARTFKRNVVPVPEGEFSRFLKRMGLGSAWRQIGLALLVLAVLYVGYFPNFLTLKTIQIDGVREADRITIEANLRDNLAKVPFYNPQRNLLFLSKARVTALLKSEQSVGTVVKIDKDFHNKSLHIVVLPKEERFMVRSNDKVFIVYDDGSLKTDTGPTRSAWDTNVNPRLIKINIAANLVIGGNKQIIAPDAVKYILDLVANVKGIQGSTLAYIDIPITENKKAAPPQANLDASNSNANTQNSAPGTASAPDAIDTLVAEENSSAPVTEIQTPMVLDELNLYFQKGTQADKTFKVLVDPTENAKNLVNRLNLLLSQTAPDRYNVLDYIDLRVANRAYVCLLNTACAN